MDFTSSFGYLGLDRDPQARFLFGLNVARFIHSASPRLLTVFRAAYRVSLDLQRSKFPCEIERKRKKRERERTFFAAGINDGGGV